MTRFARAKGSKASNERVEEEATPWHELKAQMASKYDVEDLSDNIEVSDDEQPEKSKKAEELEIEEEEEEPEQKLELSELQTVTDLLKKKRKRSQNNCLVCKKPGHLKKECPELSEDRRKELQDLFQMKIERKGQGTGRKKNKKRKLTESLDKENEVEQSEDKDENCGPSPSKKSKKSKKQKEKRKRPVKDKSGQIVQDGEGLFQGFRVLKEDVDRLRSLHDKLQKEKVPEMQEILKKERRKAEKILANSKKNVCFQCRQPGHVLSDCPQTVHKNTGKTGKCFKCGSAAHTSKECQSKLKGADAYRFADCFVCGQAGHLAKACPDNPRGLYPKGGGCRFCGSVEHLKSDCPRKVQKDAKNQVRLQRQVDQGIEEVVDNSVIKHRKVMKQQKMSKVVNF